MNISSILSLLAGLGLFLYGIRVMGDGLEQAAGDKMKRLLEVLTKNKLLAVLVGALVTGVIQSSSATTVMVVGFVNAGLLQLSQAIGVIMGANIGTTVTSLMLSVEVNFGFLFAAMGGIILLFGNKGKLYNLGQIFMGLGILFVGMQTMTDAMTPLRDWQGFKDMMTFASNPVIGVLVGALITALLQSSSASVGILQALAGTGAITLNTSLFILFGQNIGTCITALIASVGANRTAKRAAVVHLLFNVLGSVLFIIIASVLPLADFIKHFAGDNMRFQIAIAHILFNVSTTIILLPMSGLMEKLAYLVVRGEDPKEEVMHMEYFDPRLFQTPPIAVQQLFKEVMRMSKLSLKNLSLSMSFFKSEEPFKTDDFDKREEVIDFLNDEITQKLIDLKGLHISKKDTHLVGSLFHVVNDLERIGDHATNIAEIAQSRQKDNIAFSPKAQGEIDFLYEKVYTMVLKSSEILHDQSQNPEKIAEVFELESLVDKISEEYANHHVERIKNKKCTPKNGMLYLDLLNNLERIADHADNIAASVDRGENEETRFLW